MAATQLADHGHRVLIAESQPSPSRKFLMAGKSGLNLTKDEDLPVFINQYGAAADWLGPMITRFGPRQVQGWAESLGQPVFTGSSGRVFPVAMKASPLLRHWLNALAADGVELRRRWRWQGFSDHGFAFATPDGPVTVRARRCVLALGGASWARLGSDGAWVPWLAEKGVEIAPFQPSNMGFSVPWSPAMAPHIGMPVKNIALRAGELTSRGEITLSAQGLEGGGLYPLSSRLRDGAALSIDLFPDLTEAAVMARLSGARKSESTTNKLRKALKLSGARLALFLEFARPVPREPAALARLCKALPVRLGPPSPMDHAISVAGGIRQSAVDAGLMLKALPGVFAAGEMLDWDAPTGGYLLTACLATGMHAGRSAAAWDGGCL